MSQSEVTFVLTSCGRLHLLRKTLHSFLAHTDYPIARFIIIEDSGNEGAYKVVEELGIANKTTILLNKERLGQMRSIDRAYAEVKTPYIFHCEDDWEFTQDTRIPVSIRLLEKDAQIIQIYLRDKRECHPLALRESLQGIEGEMCRKIDPFCHPEWFGFSLNPGLRRLSDYHRLGNFVQYKTEDGISKAYKKLGYYMLMLDNGGVKHIGGEEHINDPFLPPRPKTILGRLKRSILKRVRRLKEKMA